MGINRNMREINRNVWDSMRINWNGAGNRKPKCSCKVKTVFNITLVTPVRFNTISFEFLLCAFPKGTLTLALFGSFVVIMFFGSRLHHLTSLFPTFARLNSQGKFLGISTTFPPYLYLMCLKMPEDIPDYQISASC